MMIPPADVGRPRRRGDAASEPVGCPCVSAAAPHAAEKIGSRINVESAVALLAA